MSHHHHHHGDAHGKEGRQAVQVEFVTATPTFDGPIGGFVTPDAGQSSLSGGGGPSFFDAGSPGAVPAPAPAFAPAPAPAPAFAPAPAPAPAFFGGQGSSGGIVGKPVQGTPSNRAPTGSPHQAANTGAPLVGKPVQHTPTPSPLADATSSSSAASSDGASPSASSGADTSQPSEGMSGGAKAGLAFGILIIIGLIAGLAFFFYRRKKNQNEKHMKIENEKPSAHQNNASITSHVSVRRAKTQAPRLSLRPMTEMFPDEKQQQRPQQDSITLGGNLTVPPAAAQKPRLPDTDTLEKSPSSNEKDISNPFGDHADTQKLSQDTFSGPGQNGDAPKPLSVKPMNGNADREPPTGGPMAAGAGPAPGPGPNNVHRVQLDFKPSMEDELELVAGQVVRMLHEYDDGWALCIRLDRSQQGVVPRSCLSKLPIKPRPAGPPPPHMRGPPPNGRPRGPSNAQSRPMSPGGGRMRSQSNTPYGGPPRPMSPYGNGPSGAGPAPDTRSRSNSNSASSARRITPPSGPMGQSATSPTQSSGIPNRKPVPGQAM